MPPADVSSDMSRLHLSLSTASPASPAAATATAPMQPVIKEESENSASTPADSPSLAQSQPQEFVLFSVGRNTKQDSSDEENERSDRRRPTSRRAAAAAGKSKLRRQLRAEKSRRVTDMAYVNDPASDDETYTACANVTEISVAPQRSASEPRFPDPVQYLLEDLDWATLYPQYAAWSSKSSVSSSLARPSSPK